MTLLLAVWLARCGWNVRVVRHLVVFLVVVAFFNVVNGISLAPGDVRIPWQLLAVATIFVPTAALVFYGAYQAREGRRPWTLKLWLVAATLAVFTVVFPASWAIQRDGKVVAGPVVMMYGLTYLTLAVLAFELTRVAIKEEDDVPKRRSMLWLALGFAFLPAYVSTSEFFFIDVLRVVSLSGVFLQVAHYMAIAAGLVLVALFVLLARAALRTKKEQQKVDVAWFLLALIGPGLSVLVLMLFVAFNAFELRMSVAVEGVWAMLFPMFAAFAVARYQSFGMTMDSRPGLRIILFGMLFPLAFGLGWLAGQNSFQEAPKWLVGLIFTGLLLPFVKILWEQTHVWASKILGMPPDPKIAKPVRGGGDGDA